MFDFYKPKEVAQMLGVTKKTVYWWVRKGRLPAVQVGEKMRITKKDLEAFVTQYKGKPKGAA